MNGSAARFVRLGVSLSGLLVLGWVLTSQAAKPEPHGLPTDWSHSHVIFPPSAGAEQEALLAQDPRYWLQRYRRELPRDLRIDPSQSGSKQDSQSAPPASSGLWSEFMGIGGAPGATNYPAKYSFSLTTANCGNAVTPDYIVNSTGLLGSGTQASIVGFDNLYTGCTGPVPGVYWAYNTGGLILTSPVLSLDGSQIAFVQTSGSPTGQAGLVLLKWKASTTQTVGTPGVPSVVTAAQYPACVAPCMTEVFLHDGTGGNLDDRTSSPYYDYTNDVAWVGGAGGWLHKITGVFKGTPTEVSGGGFPVQVNAGNALSNPVYDRVSKNIFVGDAGGVLYRVASATGVATASARLDFAVGLVESPLLDVTNGLLYVFASSDGTANCTAGVACSGLYVLSTTFGAGTKGQEVTVGDSVVTGSLPNPNPMYLGAFDSAYFNNVGGTGNLYVCGNTGSFPIIYRVPVLAGVMGSPVPGASLTPVARNPACSPVTDFSNPNASVSKTELLFFSVKNFGRPCANKGCLINFVSRPWRASTSFSQGQEILVLRTANNIAYIQTAISTGTTGAVLPAWPAVVGRKTVDGSVVWLNQGVTTVTALSGWTAAHNYGAQARILDGTNVQVSTQAGLSSATTPIWNTTIGGTTIDNAVIWINAGPWPTSSLTVTGGTGGMIVDNASTSTGASQVYFFNLSNQLCTTSGGTGICSLQASQANLQ